MDEQRKNKFEVEDEGEDEQEQEQDFAGYKHGRIIHDRIFRIRQQQDALEGNPMIEVSRLS